MRLFLAPLFLFTACAHASDPGLRGDLPHPAVANADHGEETFDGLGGVKLYGQWWRPAGDLRGVLVVQHGLNDHGDRYAHLAETLVARGYAVYALDLRGHGRSAGRRVEVDAFTDYLADETAWIARVRQKEPGKPIFVFGHSMGGVIMTLYGEAHAADTAGIVLSAPALGIDAPPIQAAVISLVARLGAPGNMLPQVNAEFSRDKSAVAEMDHDPLLTQKDGPTHTVVALIDGIEAAWADAARLTSPIVVFHGTDDQLTSPAASRDFLAHVGAADKRHVAITGGWHDLAHDPARADFENGIAAWLDAHTGGAALPDAAPGPAHLRGERIGSAMAIEAGGRIATTEGAESSGFLSTRLSLGGPIGWHGELDLRIRDGLGVDLLPAGLALRLGRAGEIAVSGGLSAGWPGSWSDDLSVPVRASLELPLGPVHLLARGTATFTVRGAGPDTYEAILAVRLFGERDLWRRVSAGSGPFAGAAWTHAAGVDVWGIVFGLHFWGVG